MKILEVTLTVQHLASAAAFYREILGLPVDENNERAVVCAGSTRLTMVPGEPFAGVHHVAFGIMPSEFELAHSWLSERVALLTSDGSEVVIGSPSWRSRSLYFLGPEDIVLELIARDADADATPGNGLAPRVLSVSEIGIAVPDVPAAVLEISHELGLPRFCPPGESFAPMGDHEGLLILVKHDRIWFPTPSLHAARGRLEVRLQQAASHRRVSVTPEVSIAAVAH